MQKPILYFKVLTSLLRLKQFHITDRLILCFIAAFQDSGGVRTSNERIGFVLGLSRHTVKNRLVHLRKLGLVETVKRKSRHRIIKIHEQNLLDRVRGQVRSDLLDRQKSPVESVEKELLARAVGPVEDLLDRDGSPVDDLLALLENPLARFEDLLARPTGVYSPDSTGYRSKEGKKELKRPPLPPRGGEPRVLLLPAASGDPTAEPTGEDPPREMSDKFAQFWEWYPKKAGRAEALRVFEALNPSSELVEKMCFVLDWKSRKPEWTEDAGRYIPQPAKWLRDEGWTDDRGEPEPGDLDWQAPPAHCEKVLDELCAELGWPS